MKRDILFEKSPKANIEELTLGRVVDKLFVVS